MLGFVRAAWAGAAAWILLWAIDGRPYSPLLWIAGLVLCVLPSVVAEVRKQSLSFTTGLMVSAGLWFFWRKSDGSTGPAMAGSEVSKQLVSFAPYVCGIVAVLLIAFWSKGARQARCRNWLFFSLCLALLVGSMSGPAASASGMEGWLMKLLHLSPSQAELATLILRKAIHFSFYGVLAWSAFWSAWHGGLYAEQAGAYGLLFSLALAGFDELRQSTASGRSGSPWDVGLDLLGAACFVALAMRFARRSEDKSAIGPRAGGNLPESTT